MKVIDYKKVDMTDEEHNYYKELVTQFTDDTTKGTEYFKDLFDVDDDGFIMLIKPTKSIPWAILFFIQQLMISQRLRIIDQLRKKEQK